VFPATESRDRLEKAAAPRFEFPKQDQEDSRRRISAEKIFISYLPKLCFASCIPARSEGRIANVTDVGQGCGGRWLAEDERRCQRTAKSCGPGAPRPWRQVRDDAFTHRTGDGGKRDGSPRRAPISRKTIAQGRPVVTACTCGSRARATRFCAGAPGASDHPAFPAPSVL
jgi:hypothetical protein